MRQLIDRESVLKIVHAHDKRQKEMRKDEIAHSIYFNLASLPTHKAEEEWLKVDIHDESTYPEYSDTNNVLLALEFWDGSKHSVTTGHCKDEDDALWFVDNCELNRNWNVTHYRPLPQPPEVEK